MELTVTPTPKGQQRPSDKQNFLLDQWYRWGSWLGLMAVAGALIVGWGWVDENYYTPESGLGYALGIVGGSLMLLLLLYPLGKRIDAMVRYVPLKLWFRLHMVCGLLGPVLILFHANFQTGSRNSTAALVSMLIVSGSGLFGRYFYTRIHHGLYGRKRELKEYAVKLADVFKGMSNDSSLSERVESTLSKHRRRMVEDPNSFASQLVQVVCWPVVWRLIRSRLIHEWSSTYSDEHKASKNSFVKSLNIYLKLLGRALEFQIYRRLFSIWHVLHIPLFVLLIVTATIHIYAVHVY